VTNILKGRPGHGVAQICLGAAGFTMGTMLGAAFWTLHLLH
jgi:hypothetical protein